MFIKNESFWTIWWMIPGLIQYMWSDRVNEYVNVRMCIPYLNIDLEVILLKLEAFILMSCFTLGKGGEGGESAYLLAALLSADDWETTD